MAILNQIDQFIIIPFSKLPIKRSTPSSPILKFIPLCNSPPLLSASDHFLDAFFFFSLFLLQVPIKRSTQSPPLLPFLLKIAIASIHPTLWLLSSLVCLKTIFYVLFQHLVMFSYLHSKDNSQSNRSISSPYFQSFPRRFLSCVISTSCIFYFYFHSKDNSQSNLSAPCYQSFSRPFLSCAISTSRSFLLIFPQQDHFIMCY